MSFTTCLFVAIGGAVGTLARYLISVAALPISQNFPQRNQYPWLIRDRLFWHSHAGSGTLPHV
jgi:hypothetical protein